MCLLKIINIVNNLNYYFSNYNNYNNLSICLYPNMQFLLIINVLYIVLYLIT